MKNVNSSLVFLIVTCVWVTAMVLVTNNKNNNTEPSIIIINTPPVTPIISVDVVPPEATTFVDYTDQIEILCLAIAIYGEARGETSEGMYAVGWVIKNRMKSRRYGSSACDVITQPYQFESVHASPTLSAMVYNAVHYNEFDFPNMDNKWVQSKIQTVAEEVYYGRVKDNTNGSTHFYAPIAQEKLGRNPPHWSTVLTKTVTRGKHVFYQ